MTDERSGDNGVVIEDAFAHAAVVDQRGRLGAHDHDDGHVGAGRRATSPIAAEGVTDFATGNSVITIDQGALFDELGMRTPDTAGASIVEMRIVDGTAYVHYPDAVSQLMGAGSRGSA